ncbi:MAG: AAA family ATPase, partial [Clostridia bacterium]|nr:AAA family ATPase [Clostridia bacterium]
SLDYVDLSVNKLLQCAFALKLKNLIEAEKKPYFARIDFQEEGAKELEKLYIGKMCLIRDTDMKPVIIDWRAPVASLYYEERLGEAHYLCPKGDIKGELKLKRQFSIEEGELQNIFDIDITTNDEFLQSYLGASADNRLKDIVSTIQAEQNRIIRADMWTPLIVQGAAGSGKTTIALHRIAYLVYTHEKTFKPESFMIIAPNTLFLNYISEILPELGVDRVRQTTFEDFAMDLIGKRFKLRNPHEKLMLLASGKEKEHAERLRRASRLKCSMRYKALVDRFLDAVEASMLPKRDFTIFNEPLMSYNELQALFVHEYKRLPVRNRLEELRKHMTYQISKKKSLFAAKFEKDCADEVMMLKETQEETPERQALIIDAFNRRDFRLKALEREGKKAINEYLEGILKKASYEHYKDFILYLRDTASDEDEAYAAQWSQEVLKSNRIEIEDLAPIIHIKYRIHGIDEKIPVRHIVIDEAQDFSAFQIYVIKRIIKDSSFTILGDLCQGIHSYRSLKNWEELKEDVFYDRRTELLTLEQSYRTTIEIMDAANIVAKKMAIPDVPLAKPVFRHGDPVRLIRDKSDKDRTESITARIQELLKMGLKLIAVIAKTAEDCELIHHDLKKQIKDLTLITGAEGEYNGGVMVVPAHLAKGLEFDGVILADVSKDKYHISDMDAKLLYVAMTRAMHIMDIHYMEEISPLLEGFAFVEI